MLVDHESWENIVQAAPVMAVVLNKTNIYSNNNKTNVTNRERQEKVNIKYVLIFITYNYKMDSLICQNK